CSAVTLRNCECGRHQAPHRHVELVVHRHFRRDYGARTAETGTHAGLGDGGVARAFEQLNENRVRAWRSGYASANGNWIAPRERDGLAIQLFGDRDQCVTSFCNERKKLPDERGGALNPALERIVRVGFRQHAHAIAEAVVVGTEAGYVLEGEPASLARAGGVVTPFDSAKVAVVVGLVSVPIPHALPQLGGDVLPGPLTRGNGGQE